MMSSRSASAFGFALVGLLLVSGCSAPAGLEAGRERGSVAYDPYRSARTDTFVSSSDVLTTVKSPPVRVVMPDLDLDMGVDPEGIEPNGDMGLPVSPFRAGWYKFGAAPNSPTGATVLAAHVDNIVEGVGPFSRLREARDGMAVVVRDADGTRHEYRVVSVERIEKAEVQIDRYFSNIGEQRIVLITCGGEFDRQAGSYKDNYIVTAEKVS
ncbi:MAG: class F sortase [Microcella sp.]